MSLNQRNAVHSTTSDEQYSLKTFKENATALSLQVTPVADVDGREDDSKSGLGSRVPKRLERRKSLIETQSIGHRESDSVKVATRVPLPDSTSTVLLRHTRSSVDSETPVTNNQDDRHSTSLPPVDGGFGAWSFLLAAFFVENIIWGFPNSFGVFLDAYLRDSTYSTQPHAFSLLPLIGTLTTGIIYCSGKPFTYPLIYRYPKLKRLSLWIGAVICWASLFGASYTTKVTHLVLCQGVLYAIGGAMLYNPCLSYMSEWFVARRGLANGVINAGTATGGLVLPLVLPSIIEKHGISKTLRMLAIVFSAMLLPLLPFMRGRLPPSKVTVPPTRSGEGSKTWMKHRNFHFLMLINTLQGLGYFVPLVWLPTFASEMNLSPSKASLTLAMLNGAQVVGRLSAGMVSDRIDPWLLSFSTLVGTCMATFILWGVLSHSLGGLIAFGLVYGSLAGGWSSMWTGFIRQIVHEDPKLSTTFIGYLMMTRGLGNILSTPISTALSSSHGGSRHHPRLGFDVGGGKFENVILYAGSCFAAASLIAAIGWGVDLKVLKRMNGAGNTGVF
ncbi:MFS general substrate transporter [Serendipita vermifera]|nr:MFS general substrate transporter [Serendipita vermifera]